MIRSGGLRLAMVLLAWCLLPALSLAADAPQVQFNTDNIGPRPIEDVTARNIPRDWGYAWQMLEQAMDSNRADILGRYFTGIAQQKLAAAVASQAKSGLHRHYIDHGHKLAAYFYSPDGGEIELHDTADLEIQTLDGGSVIHSERVTLHYVGLMTPAADHWEVRLLEAVPKF